MTTLTINDLKHQWLLDNTGLSVGSIQDLEWAYYSPLSGLTPVSFYSIADHKRAYFEAQTGLSKTSLNDLERAYWLSQGISSKSFNDMAYEFYDFNPFSSSSLPGLELALDASKITNTVSAPSRTNLVTNPRAVGSTGKVNVRTNLCTNPNFETGIVGWTGGSGGIRDIVNPISGTASCRIDATNGQAYFVIAGVVAGETYTFSVDYRTVGTLTGAPQLKIAESSNGWSGSALVLPLTQTTPGRFSKTYTILGAGSVAFYVFNGTGSIHFDNVLIEKSTTADPHFDGSMAAEGDFTYVWSGVANASTSYQQADNVTGYSQQAAGIGLVYRGIQGTGFAAKIEGSKTAYFWSASGAATVGKFCSARVTVKGPAGRTVSIRIYDGIFLSDIAHSVVLTGVPTEYVIPGTVASSTTNVRVYIYSQAGWLAGDILSMTNVLIETFDEAGVIPGPYLDGSIVEDDFVYVWTGAVDASASTETSLLAIDGGKVAQWDDLSGNGRHVVQATDAKRPLYRSVNKNLLLYSLWNSTSTDFAAVRSVAVVDAATFPGESVYKITCDGLNTGSSNISFPTSKQAVIPNTTVTASTQIRHQAGSLITQYRLSILWYKSDKITLSTILPQSTGSLTTTTSVGWTDVNTTAVVPADAVWCVFVVSTGVNSTVPDVYFVRKCSIVEGVVPSQIAPVTLPNGLPTVQFDGVDDVLSASMNKFQNHSIYVVANAAITAASKHIVYHRTINGTWIESSITSIKGSSRNPDTTFSSATIVIDQTFNHVIAGIFKDTFGIVLSVDGTPLSGGIYTYLDEGSMSLSIASNGTQFYTGSVAAVLIFSEAHDDSTRKRIEKWLGSKYGIEVS